MKTLRRPCECDNVVPFSEYTPDQCRQCWLFHHSPGVNQLWGGNGILETGRSSTKHQSEQAVPCIFRVDDDSIVANCTTCRNKPKMFRCNHHGVTHEYVTPYLSTIQLSERKLAYGSCKGCMHRRVLPPPTPPPEYSGAPIVRHFLYHVGPFQSADKQPSPGYVWRRNIEQVLERMHLFNGKRIVGIVTGPGLDDPDEVKRAFKGEVEEFIVAPNDPRLREVVTYEPMLERIESLSPDELFFYSQAKGVTHPYNPGVTVHDWTRTMYEVCLDYYPLAEKLLEKYGCAGPYLKTGRGFSGSLSSWHYSGSFYWVRSCALFSRNWRNIDRKWYGVESTIGATWFDTVEAACLFHEGTVPELNLYHKPYMDAVLQELEQWKEHNQQYRTVRP